MFMGGTYENCLLLFATINKSNAETYRLLVSKLGDSWFSLEEYKPSSRKALCLLQWACISSECGKSLLQTKSFGCEAAELKLSYQVLLNTVMMAWKRDDKYLLDQLELLNWEVITLILFIRHMCKNYGKLGHDGSISFLKL